MEKHSNALQYFKECVHDNYSSINNKSINHNKWQTIVTTRKLLLLILGLFLLYVK